MKKFVPFNPIILTFWIFLVTAPACLFSQVVEVFPVFPRVDDDVTITFNAAEGNGALLGVAPVYAHTGVITSESTSGTDWKHVQGNWGTADPRVLMTSIGNNLHTITYNIEDYYGINAGEEVYSLAFVFRNANGSIVGRATDGADIFYPVYPDNVEFLSVLLAPQTTALALFEHEIIQIKGATSIDADLYLIDNGDTLATAFAQFLEYSLTVTEAGNHDVQFVAVHNGDTLVQSFFYTVIVSVEVEDPPAGREDGMTIINDSTVHFQLYAPQKTFVHLIGDMTGWDLRSDYQMKKSVDGNTWWIEVTGLDPGSRYGYQYIVDGEIRIGDPYSTLVLDSFNDGFITASTYPSMPVYPFGETNGIVTTFVLAYPDSLETLVEKPAKENLIIYELLLRDFLHAHSFQKLRDTLDYLQRLGVNAIELMPVQEFEGNYGWGYNPSYHMALDKFYGPEQEFRNLIEEAHSRGMAIILDVVYNHAFGQSPLAQLYWDAPLNRPSVNNPWLNPVAKHDFNVGYDFNHESAATRYFVKRVISYWMETFGIDGFRFDLSKGFTQKNTLGNIGAWGAYDASRVAIWQDYADHVWSIDPDAYIILEHFADNTEEKILSDRGMMLWGNLNYAYGQASMGYGSSDVSWISYIKRGWNDPHVVGYMESHDEERLMYKNLTSGNSGPGYNVKELTTALKRIELVSAFFYLIQGPKMIWEFGELGYDYSINYCPNGTVNPNCRLDPKPIRWDYQQVTQRKRLYDVVRALIRVRDEVAFQDGTMELSVASPFEKIIRIRHTDMDIVVTGNFNISSREIVPVFTRTGWWYDYLGSDSIFIDDLYTSLSFEAGEYHVWTTKKLDPGFDITTSNKEIVRSGSLLIYPSINSGEFQIAIPDENSFDGEIEILSLAGQPAGFKFQAADGYVDVEMDSAVTGIYIVKMVYNGQLWWGKAIVQK